MPNQPPAPPDDFLQRQRALACWENEGGKALPIDLSRAGSVEHAPVPEMTNA